MSNSPASSEAGDKSVAGDSAVAVILGSAFDRSLPANLALEAHEVETAWGVQVVHTVTNANATATATTRPAYVIFRHGLPHQRLPHQINYRAQAAALKQLGVGALVVNSSVGVMDAAIPLNQPLLVSDLYMPENRLPDGSTCTMFTRPSPDHAHLVLREGLFSPALAAQLSAFAPGVVRPREAGLVFAYAGGPRTKTPAENLALARLGAQVNSMTLGPEIVLANELGIPCAGLVVGHKYSVPGVDNPAETGIRASLEAARAATERVLVDFLLRGRPVAFGNDFYRW